MFLAWVHASKGQGAEPFGPLGAEPPQQSVGMNDASASQQIDAIVRKTAGWRGERLGQLRALIRGADPGVIGEALKSAVRLTLPKGGQLKDTKGLFNTRLDIKMVRAVYFHEGDAVKA